MEPENTINDIYEVGELSQSLLDRLSDAGTRHIRNELRRPPSSLLEALRNIQYDENGGAQYRADFYEVHFDVISTPGPEEQGTPTTHEF